MKIWNSIIIGIFILAINTNVIAMDQSKGGSGDKAGGHSGGHSGGHQSTEEAKVHAMDSHGGHKTDSSGAEQNFTHSAMMDGIHSEFQVMSLASMNMTDPDGNTHHIMVKLTRGDKNDDIKGAVGKIKVIAPSGKEQISTLKDYSGIMAGNFTFNEKGNYGVICLVKVGEDKRVFKFWYPHE